MVDDFEKRLMALKREVLELKTAQQLSPRLKGYTKSTTLGQLGATTSSLGHIRITYGDGDSEILTEFISDLSIWPAIPDGDTQDANCLAYTGSAAINAPIFIMSTRPITSVVLVE